MKIILIIMIVLPWTEIWFNKINQDESEITSMEVCYIKGSFEPHNPLVCGQVLNYLESDYALDTVLTDPIILRKVENLVEKFRSRSLVKKSPLCDIRVQCSLNFKNGSSRKVCIGEINCIYLDATHIGKCYKLEYLIKMYSGYYNYYEEWQLNYSKEIKKYGIPKGYRYILN